MPLHKTKEYYNLVAADTHPFNLFWPSAYEVAIYRLKRGEWGLNLYTKYRRLMKPGDEVIIYASGTRENGLHFIATATISSYCREVPFEKRHIVDAPREKGFLMSEYSISLKQVRIFSKMVDIRAIKHQLSFVKSPNSSKWGACLRGGAQKLSRHDYQLILKEAGLK